MLSIDALPTGRIFAFHSRTEERLSRCARSLSDTTSIVPRAATDERTAAADNNNDVWGLKTHLPPVRRSDPHQAAAAAVWHGNDGG